MLPYSKPCRQTGHGARTPHCKEARPAKWREMSGKSYDAESRFIPPSTLSPAGGSKTLPGRFRKEGTRRGMAKKISLAQRIAFSLTSARVYPSDCCGKIPWSGSRWNSRSVRSICIRTGSSRHLRKVRAFSSGCFGKIPRSGSIRNSKNARSTCNKASYRLLLPGQGSLRSEVHPERICVPPCENHSTMTSGCAKPPRPKLRGLVVLGNAESESS